MNKWTAFQEGLNCCEDSFLQSDLVTQTRHYPGNRVHHFQFMPNNPSPAPQSFLFFSFRVDRVDMAIKNNEIYLKGLKRR